MLLQYDVINVKLCDTSFPCSQALCFGEATYILC